MHKHFALLMTTTFGLGVTAIMENWAVEGQMVVKYPWRSILWLALVLLRYPNSSFKTTSNEYMNLLNTIGKKPSTHIENQKLNFEHLPEYFMQNWSQKQKCIFHRLVTVMPEGEKIWEGGSSNRWG